MQTPPDQNTRAEAMWRIISQHVDFRGKRVMDLGCGTGDFLWRVAHTASKVVGVDKDSAKIATLAARDGHFLMGNQRAAIASGNLGVLTWDLNNYSELIKGKTKHDYSSPFNVALCFSVLPYLDNIPAVLEWMAYNFELCLIEAQYAPEPYNVGVLSDRGMAQLLLNSGFVDVEPLGYTVVKDRFDDDGNPTKRTIWMCK